MADAINIKPSNIPELSGWKQSSVRMYVTDAVNVYPCSGQGERAFIRYIDRNKDKDVTYQGSWGGSNPFEGSIDSGFQCELEPGIFVVVGVRANVDRLTEVYMHPNDAKAFISNDPKPVLTEDQQAALDMWNYTSAYRKEGWPRRLGKYEPTNPILVSLVELGLLKKVGTGLGLTPEGRNLKGRGY